MSLLQRVFARGRSALRLPATFYVWGMLLAVVSLSPISASRFHVQDDHDEAMWLGSSGAMPWAQIWPNMMETEVGGLGHAGRFRPMFFIVKLVESAALGNHPGWHYGLRILFFGIFLGCIAHVLAKACGAVAALLLTLLISGLYFWNDVWTLSLGPAEQEALLGLALMVVGGNWFVTAFVRGDETLPLAALPLIALGSAVASGSKENFCVFVGLPLAFAALALWFGRLRLLSLVLSVPLVLLSGLTFYALYAAGRNQTDFYGADNSLGHRLQMVLDRPVLVAFLALSILGAALAPRLVLRASPRDPWRRASSTMIFVVLVAFFVMDLAWELFFYNGRLPSVDAERYELLYRLLPIAILCCFIGYLRFAFPRRERAGALMARYALTLLAISYVLLLHPTFSLRAAARSAAAESTRFDDAMRKFASSARQHPDWPVIIEAADPWDFEPVQTFSQWKRYYDIPNPLRVRTDLIKADRIHDAFERQLVQGMADRRSIDASEIDKLHGACLAIGINEPSASNCSVSHVRMKPSG